MAVLSFSPLQSSVLAPQRLQTFAATGISCSGVSAAHQICFGSTAVVTGLVMAIMRKSRLPQLHQRSWTPQREGRRPLRKTTYAAAPTTPQTENYVPILVERADGSKIEVEVRPSDTVKVLKAMIAVKTGVPEASQELAASGMKMEDFCLMSEYNLKEGALYTLAELKEDAKEVVLAPVAPKDGEVCTRVYVICDAAFGKQKVKKVAMDVTATDIIKDIKVRAYKEFAETVEPFRKKDPSSFGLFIPQSPVSTGDGNLRALSRSKERLPETSTTEEAGLKGDEEMLLVDLFWTKM